MQRGNQWSLVLSDYFTRWLGAVQLANATAPTVATALNERILCYFGLPEQLHSNLGKQFQSRLMAELSNLWRVDQTHTTPYHPQSNKVVERGNRVLGDALRALLRDREQGDWNLVLLQLLRAFRGTPQASTGETANMLMLGKELRLPDLLMNNPPPGDQQVHSEYVQSMVERLEKAHTLLREQQMAVRQDDSVEPFPPFVPDWWSGISTEYQKKERENPKLQPKFIRPYEVVVAFGNHTYQLERLEQTTTQNECRLKLYQACTERRRQAPEILENKGCKTPGKNTKTKCPPPKHLGGYIEKRYVEPEEQFEYLPELVAVPDNHETNLLECVKERVKVERELTKIEKEVDSNHSFNATTNEDRESSLERNLPQDADANDSFRQKFIARKK